MTTTEVAVRAFAQQLQQLERRGELELQEPERAGRRAALIVAAASVWARHLGGLLDGELIETFRPADVSPWTIASFLGSPQRELEGQTPQRWLLAGGEQQPVREAAGRIAARLAH